LTVTGRVLLLLKFIFSSTFLHVNKFLSNIVAHPVFSLLQQFYGNKDRHKKTSLWPHMCARNVSYFIHGFSKLASITTWNGKSLGLLNITGSGELEKVLKSLL